MSKNNSSGGIGFLSLLSILLTVAFFVLKLCHTIDWAWIWVLSPLWIYVCVFIILVTLYAWAKVRVDKNEKNRVDAGYNSKWQQRLEQMQEAQKKAAAARGETLGGEPLSTNKNS